MRARREHRGPFRRSELPLLRDRKRGNSGARRSHCRTWFDTRLREEKKTRGKKSLASLFSDLYVANALGFKTIYDISILALL